ncbi:MAG: tetratricopeptide repeat protein [Magnetococcales bacterium]|nr:tetratricopeptide repeat protein [Magnetococcales bacterium]
MNIFNRRADMAVKKIPTSKSKTKSWGNPRHSLPRWAPLFSFNGWLLLFLVVVPAWAGTESRLDEAIGLYLKAQEERDPSARRDGFRQSARLFRELADGMTPHAALHTNLGNAALQGGDLGQAILAFRRALVLDPGHEQARNNLHHARDTLPPTIPRPATDDLDLLPIPGMNMRSTTGRAALEGILFFLGAALVAIAVQRKSVRTRIIALIPFLLWMTLLLHETIRTAREKDHAVIVQEETIGHAADSINSPPAFPQPLPAGTEVRILERRRDWIRITLANGGSAWIRSSDTALIDHHRPDPE